MLAYRLSTTTAPIAARVPIEQARSLQRLATRRGLTVSDVVAVLVAREFSDNADQPTPTPTPPITTTTDQTERTASASEPTPT
jgi:hypothetical protein